MLQTVIANDQVEASGGEWQAVTLGTRAGKRIPGERLPVHIHPGALQSRQLRRQASRPATEIENPLRRGELLQPPLEQSHAFVG